MRYFIGNLQWRLTLTSLNEQGKPVFRNDEPFSLLVLLRGDIRHPSFLIVLLVNNSWFKSFSLFSCRKDSVYFNTIRGKWEKSEVGGGNLRWGWRLFAWIVCAYSTKRCSFDAKFNRNTQINLTFANSACLGVLRRAKRPVGPSEEVFDLLTSSSHAKLEWQ